MQSVSSRIWTRITVSISYDDNHYTTGISNDINPTVHIQMHIQIQIRVKTGKYKWVETGGLCCLGTNFSSLRYEERDTVLTMLTIPNAQLIWWCLRSLSLEICKTPTICPNGRELIYLLPLRKFNYPPAWSSVNLQLTVFQNPQILCTISSRHDVIHSPIFSMYLSTTPAVINPAGHVNILQLETI